MRPSPSSSISRIAGALASWLMAALFVIIYSSLARAADIKVDIDHAALVRLDQPGAEVIIGNPSIADVTVQSGRLLIVTGKSIGLTNLIVLDGSGEVFLQKKVHVGSDRKKLVTLSRGISRETYSCSPNCSPALVPGDTDTFFDALSKGTRTKLGLAQSSAEGTTSEQ